jgi:hypothetical protein
MHFEEVEEPAEHTEELGYRLAEIHGVVVITSNFKDGVHGSQTKRLKEPSRRLVSTTWITSRK